jgi:hypothetical protein
MFKFIQTKEMLFILSSAPTSVLGHRREAALDVDSWWLYFPVHREVSDAEQVDTAVLRLMVRQHRRRPQRRRKTLPLVLRVFRVLADGESLLLDERRLDAEGGDRWLEMRVASAVDAWLLEPAANLGLKIQCKGCRLNGANIDTQVRIETLHF